MPRLSWKNHKMKKISSKTKTTLTGVGAIIFGLIGLLSLIRSPFKYFTQASPLKTPKEIKLTNASENSLTVSWLTDDLTKGFVFYSLSDKFIQKTLALDDRPGQPSSKIHSVTLKNLQPGKTYYYIVGSDENTFDNNGLPYQFPLPAIPPLTPLPPFAIKGKIVKNSQPAKDILVYFSFQNSNPISTLTDINGNYLLNLNNTRSKDLNITYPLQKNEKGYLLIVDGTNSLIKPVIIEDNLTLTDISLDQQETASREEVVSPKSLETNLPAPAESKQNFNLITVFLNFLRQILGLTND